MLIWVETVLLRCTNINQKKPGLGQKSRKTMRQHSTNTRRAHQLIPSNPSADGLDASVLLKTPHQGKHTNSDIVCLTFANAVMSRLTDNITYSPHRHFITRSSNWSWWPHTCAGRRLTFKHFFILHHINLNCYFRICYEAFIRFIDVELYCHLRLGA